MAKNMTVTVFAMPLCILHVFDGGNAVGNAVGNLVGNLAEKVLMACNWSKNGKNIGNFWHLWEIFKPITSTKTL